MSEAPARLRALVAEWAPRLSAQGDEEAGRHSAPGRWSAKELVGHLIDSGGVNLERFLRARASEDLVAPGYPQDEWVAAQGFDEAPWDELVELWRTLNLHIARVMQRTPEADLDRPRARHNLDEIAFKTVPRSEPTTLGYLMDDYVVHLEHHLHSLDPLHSGPGGE